MDETVLTTSTTVTATTTDAPWAGRRLFFEDMENAPQPSRGVYPDNPRVEVDDPALANLVSSLADDGPPWVHRPVIDIDHPCELTLSEQGLWHLSIGKPVYRHSCDEIVRALTGCGLLAGVLVQFEDGKGCPGLLLTAPCRLIPSTTEGHFHLYIDKAVQWYEFDMILYSMSEAGIVEGGYYKAARRRGATFVRMPGVKKPVAEADAA